MSGSRTCPHCGAWRPKSEKYCGFCGETLPFVAEDLPPSPGVTMPTNTPPPAQQQQLQPPPPDQGLIYRPGYNPTAAIVGGLFIVGLGQLINGQVAKFFTFFLVACVLAPLTSFIGSIAIWLFAFADAYTIGMRLKNGQSVTPWQMF